MSQAILYTPASPYFGGLVDNPFFDSSINLTPPLFINLHGKAVSVSGNILYPIYAQTLRDCMSLLWQPSAWRMQFDAFDRIFPSIPRIIGGGGYYPGFIYSGTENPGLAGSGFIGAYYVQLPIMQTPEDPVNSLYDIGWSFQFITPDPVDPMVTLSAFNRPAFPAPIQCGVMNVTCGNVVFSEPLYSYDGQGVAVVTLTAIF